MGESAPQRFGAPAMLLAISLASAFLEAAAGIAGGKGLFAHFGRTLMSAGATALVILALAALLYGLSAIPARRRGAPERLSRAAWSGAFAGTALLLGSMAGVVVWPLYNADLLRWMVILVVALAAAAGARRAVEALSAGESAGTRPARAMIWAPAAAAAFFFLVWWTRYQVDALASAGTLLGAGAAAAALALAVAASTAVRRAGASLAVLSVVLLVMLAAPAAAFVMVDRLAEPEGGGGVPGPPRVILISVDTLRADALSAYGGAVPTPALDALAAESRMFTRAYAPSPWTLPSVATLLTGSHPDIHGMRKPGARLAEGFPTLAAAMKSAGYRTAAIGSNPHLGRASGLDQGFDEYVFHGGTPMFLVGGPVGARLVQRLFPPALPVAGTTEELTALGLEWLERNRRLPFFLWIHFLDPHIPHTPPERFRPEVDPPPDMGFTFARQGAIRMGYFAPSAEQREWIRRLYLAEVRYVDHAVGRILDRLEELGLDREALIVLTSDHGEEFWEHGGYEHGHTLYEEVLRVPLLIRAPGGAPAVIDRPVSLESVAPTLLEMAGVPFDPGRFPGESLARLTGGAGPGEAGPLVATAPLYHEDRISVRFGGWKYIRPLISPGEELYDLASDPAERISVAASRPGIVARAAERLKAHFAAVREARARLGESGEGEPLDDETLEQLRSLGYVE